MDKFNVNVGSLEKLDRMGRNKPGRGDRVRAAKPDEKLQRMGITAASSSDGETSGIMVRPSLASLAATTGEVDTDRCVYCFVLRLGH